MAWKSFAKHIHGEAGTLGGSPRHLFHIWRANKWIRDNNNKPYDTILEIYEADGKPYEYDRDYDRDAAHFAISGILGGELARPEGWKADEVFLKAATVRDRSLFSSFATSFKYKELIIPLLVQMISEPDLDSPHLWAEIIGKCGPAAKEALPGLLTIASKWPYTEDSRVAKAIQALSAQPTEKAKPEPADAPVPSGPSSHAHRFEVRSINEATWCDVCREPVTDFVRWCEGCGLVVHTWCAKSA